MAFIVFNWHRIFYLLLCDNVEEMGRFSCTHLSGYASISTEKNLIPGRYYLQRQQSIEKEIG